MKTITDIRVGIAAVVKDGVDAGPGLHTDSSHVVFSVFGEPARYTGSWTVDAREVVALQSFIEAIQGEDVISAREHYLLLRAKILSLTDDSDEFKPCADFKDCDSPVFFPDDQMDFDTEKNSEKLLTV